MVDSLVKSYRYAEKVARREARNFYYTFRFLPPLRRRSIFAIYTYSRRLDDAVDSVDEAAVAPEAARASLFALRSLIGPNPPDDPLTPALADTLARYRIPVALLEELVLGMEMDLCGRRYETFSDLYVYCYRVASAVGLVCLEVFGYLDPSARAPAEKLGIAMQLTNILRDVAEDLRRGRVYLPEEDLERFQVSHADLRRGVAGDGFRALMRFEVERARQYFADAEPLFPLVLEESRYCPILLKQFYSRILDRIVELDFDVLHHRPRLRLSEKLQLLAKTWCVARWRSLRTVLGGRGSNTMLRPGTTSRSSPVD